MNEAGPLVGIDLGSSTVSVVVGEMEDERLVVRGCGLARHDGARKGVVANLEEVAQAVQVAAEEAEAMASIPVEIAQVGIGGTPIQGVPSTASVPVTGRDHTVTQDDLRRALAACAQVSIPDDYRVLDIIPCGFALDGQPGMDHPVGMPGTRLDASAYVLYANRTHAETVEQSINHAAVAVKQLVFEPLAAAEAVLTSDEKELGCLLLDMGYATTEWVLFVEGSVASSGAVPVGGRHFTADLAAMLKTVLRRRGLARAGPGSLHRRAQGTGRPGLGSCAANRCRADRRRVAARGPRGSGGDDIRPPGAAGSAARLGGARGTGVGAGVGGSLWAHPAPIQTSKSGIDVERESGQHLGMAP